MTGRRAQTVGVNRRGGRHDVGKGITARGTVRKEPRRTHRPAGENPAIDRTMNDLDSFGFTDDVDAVVADDAAQPLSDAELDQLLPAEGYTICEPPSPKFSLHLRGVVLAALLLLTAVPTWPPLTSAPSRPKPDT